MSALPVSDADRARAELERRRREHVAALVRSPIVSYVPTVTPDFAAPNHLGPLLDVIERCKQGEPLRVLLSVPPQHGKTETLLHAIGQLLGIFPRRTYAYVTYEAKLSRDKSEKARKYAVAAGVPLRKRFRLSKWETTEGGAFIATSIGGPLTGEPISGGLIIDDPFKNREAAESKVIRDGVHSWATSTGFTRLHPSAFVIVLHTRWHEDDLIGRLENEYRELDDGSRAKKWEVINLPAIIDGIPNEPPRALWPEGRPLSFLRDMRASIGEYDFSALFQGRPRPKGHNVFKGVHYYDRLPNRYRIGKGLDLSYSKKTRADWSVGLVLAEANGEIFILDVVRKRCEVRAFIPELQALDARYPGPWNFVCSGMEGALVDLAPTDGIVVNVINAVSDKFARAQPIAARWNGDPATDDPTAMPVPPRVFVPREATWLTDFLSEINTFTGVGDVNDDQVDALSGAFEGIRHIPIPPKTSDKGDRRYGDMGGYGRG